MIKQDVLEEVCAGLEEMMKKFKRNQVAGDKERYEATKQAHAALRKVILTMTIKGDIQSISPIQNGSKYGWAVIDAENSLKNYSA
ncbi:hypothetical protein [Bacteriovorax sp. Seq25_V]|uniref:hypothetical protein n=1 Tax=Bacteriovorax sp. Seq25_V TaxID=1201288 RepID=UPI00038A3571|nr:hypothetical protein [Bacteriovorax sp. Seq25_V]EQC45719.1 hypothetical protein M900_2251 [Bacteriovorax sp. Seq25_V]